jgi:hypothetical protein
MNRNIVVFHLKEAAEQLSETIRNLFSNQEVSAGTFEVEMLG